MIDDLRMLKDKLEAATEELALIPRAEWNRQKIADREYAIECYRLQIARLEATHKAFVDRRHELLARCAQFATMR